MVLLPESMPSIVLGVTLSVISLIGYSAMAGAIGGAAWVTWPSALDISDSGWTS